MVRTVLRESTSALGIDCRSLVISVIFATSIAISLAFTHGDTYICLGQCMRVVDTIAYHGHYLVFAVAAF